MADRDLRLAQREGADLDARVSWLVARKRRGEIPELDAECDKCKKGPGLRTVPCVTCNGTGRRTVSGLELAAYLGDEAARVVLGWVGGAGRMQDESLDLWARGLEQFGFETCVRAALAAAEVAYAYSPRAHGYGDPQERRLACAWRAIERVKQWVADPSEENRRICRATQASGPFALLLTLVSAKGHESFHASWLVQILKQSSRAADEQAVRDAIREALVPWALGLGEANDAPSA